ncbi:sodium:solute symporter family protein [Dietzia sp. NPDC055340]
MSVLIVLVYFAILIAIGLLARRRVAGSTEEFFIAGRSLGTFVNSWAFLASLASGGSILAATGTAVALGLPYFTALVAGAPVGFVVAAILVARPLRRTGKFTVPDYFRLRYNNAFMRWAVPIIVVLASGAYLVAQLKGASIVGSYLLGWDITASLWATGIVFILYVSIGGFLSVTWNDIFQGILMFSMVAGLSVVVINAVGDPLIAFESATTQFPTLGAVSEGVPVISYVGAFLTFATAMSVLPHVIMRVFSAKNEKSARKSLNYATLIYGTMMFLVLFVISVGAAVLLDDIDTANPDAAFLELTDQLLPSIWQGFVVAAILAAVMSTTAGLLHACSAAIGHDLYHRIIRPQASEREVVRVSFVATWVIGLVCIILTLNPPDLLIVLYTAAVGLLASAFFAPMVLGIWWTRANSAGATAGMSAGAIAFGLAYFLLDLGPSTEILFGLPVSFLVTIVVSLLTQRETLGDTQFDHAEPAEEKDSAPSVDRPDTAPASSAP